MLKIIRTDLNWNDVPYGRDLSNHDIVLHHSATEQATVESIHSWHQSGNGWCGIGYHYLVRKNGEIYQGRPEKWAGAHTYGYNHMLGICAEGNFEKEQMPDPQRRAIAALIRDIFRRNGTGKLYAHRDLDHTLCPGKYFPFAEIAAEAAGEPRGEEPAFRWQSVEQVSGYGRKTVQKLIDKGYLSGKGGSRGLDLSEDMVRTLVILDRTGIFD